MAEDTDGRGWAAWLEMRGFTYNNGHKHCKVTADVALSLMAWQSVTSTIVEANKSRDFPLPLPSSPTQLQPYQKELVRVDDWKPDNWPVQAGAPATGFETQPPYAASQPKFLESWEGAWNTIDPEKRAKKNRPVPPSEKVSRAYQAAKAQILSPEVPEPVATVNVGQATQKPLGAPPKKPVMPKKTQAEIEAEKAAFQLETDARSYRMALLTLKTDAEKLKGLLSRIVVNAGTHEVLDKMRALNLGAYSVDKDVEYLREAVTVLQDCFNLATKPYEKPTAIEVELDPSEQTIDL